MISAAGKLQLVVLNGTVNSAIYQQTFRTALLLFARSHHLPGALCMQDNALDWPDHLPDRKYLIYNEAEACRLQIDFAETLIRHVYRCYGKYGWTFATSSCFICKNVGEYSCSAMLQVCKNGQKNMQL